MYCNVENSLASELGFNKQVYKYIYNTIYQSVRAVNINHISSIKVMI